MTIDRTPARAILRRDINLDGFTPDEQEEILVFLEENVMIKVHTDIYNLLEGDDKITFLNLSAKVNNPEIGAFLNEKIADMEGIIRRAAEYVVRDFNDRVGV